MKAPTITLWMAAGALEAQTDLGVKVRLLTCLNAAGQQARQAAQKLARHGAKPGRFCFEFNVEPPNKICKNLD